MPPEEDPCTDKEIQTAGHSEDYRGKKYPQPFEEEKLKFYITSCSFCPCNSACSLQNLDHIGHVVSESGDLKIQGTGAYLTHPCPALCNCPVPANLLNHACLCKDQAFPSPSFFFLIYFYLFIWLCQVFVVACELSCSMWNLVPWPGIEPRPPALGAQSLGHWTTREVSPSPSWLLIPCAWNPLI